MNDERLRITFSREGGFVGRPLTSEVDTDTLPADEAATLRQLVDAAHVFDTPPSPINRSVRDGFTFRLSVIGGTRRTSLEASEGAMSDEMASLFAFLTALAKKSARPHQP